MDNNGRISRNNPVWNQNTVTVADTATAAGYTQITVQGSYVIVSNKGTLSFYIGSDGANPGVLVAPGAAFETAISSGGKLFIHAAGVTGSYCIVWYE